MRLKDSKLERFLEINAIEAIDGFFFFVPLNGCGECKNLVLKFLKEYDANYPLKVILSSTSNKSINMTIEQEKLDEEIILIDSENFAYKMSIATNNPAILTISNGNICSLKTVNLFNVDSTLTSVQLALKKAKDP